MTETTIGTCSLCGGPVRVSAVWYGGVPPTPSCDYCGAVPRNSHGPVIEMTPGTRMVQTAGTKIVWTGNG